MRNLIAFLIGVTIAALLCVSCAHAETIPATYVSPAGSSGASGYASENTSGWFCGGGTKRDDPETACDYCSGQYVPSRHAAESFTFAAENGVNVLGYRCRTAVENGDGLVANITPSGVGTCPDGMTSAGTYTCSGTCPAGQELVNGYCTPGTYTCPSTGGWAGPTLIEGVQSCTRSDCVAQKGQTANSGYYDMGTSANTPFPAVGCYGGCSAIFDGTAPSKTSMVDGITHYYAEGEYIYDDWACSGTTSPTPVTGSPTDTCAQGQTLTQIAGNAVCVDTQTGEPQDPNAPCSDVVLQGSPTTNADGSETTVTTTIKCDGTKTQTSKTTFPDGSSEEETEDQTPYDPLNPGTGSGAGGGGTGTGTPDAATVGEGVDAGIESYCTTNPNSPICKETSSGEAASTSDLYQSKADGKTFEGVFDNFNNRIQAAPAISAATQFFDVSNLPAGSCAGLDTSFTIFGETFEVNLTDVFCSSFATELYSYLNLGVQLVATWLAFTIAFL